MLPDEVRKAVEVDPADLLIEVWPPDPGGMRAYMPRGVKVTHKPTGIIATCDDQRTHHATLADMAKRLEAAERDAPALTDAQCDAIYSALDDYGREVDHFEFGLPWHCDGGPEKRREVIRAAIAATQEGER